MILGVAITDLFPYVDGILTWLRHVAFVIRRETTRLHVRVLHFYHLPQVGQESRRLQTGDQARKIVCISSMEET
jgi:hypothetical protein